MIQSARGLLKGAAERVLVGSGVAARARRRNGDRIAVLAYHNVVPARATGRGDVSLHLSLDAFRRQLDRLQETHRIVGLGAVGRGRGSGEAEDDGPAAALTFDDAYRGALRHAVPELVRRGLPATVFVCPGLLGSEGFWWDRIADTPSGPGPERRRAALETLGGRQRDVLDAYGGRPAAPDYRPADVDEVGALAREPGITLASHTWSHPNLTAAGDDELREELVRSRDWLAREVGEPFLPEHLTFPYGLQDERVAAAARAAGYRFLWRVEGGLAGPEAAGGVLPRVNVPAGVSLRGFELRTSGVVA